MLELVKGTRLAERYTLERPLGRGGEAQTWLARDGMTGALVALKIVPTSGGAGKRLRKEWETNLRLMHAHIVRVFEFYEDQEAAFYSLQYIDGPDLGSLAGMPADEVLPPLGLVADALRYAHAKGIVHRDVKASNVLLDHNGVPYLSDFGVAAGVGEFAGGGSRIAASPQVLGGEAAQPADDIYALGILFAELLSPVPAAARNLVDSMLSEDAGKRPSAAEVGDILRQAGFAPGPARAQITSRPGLAEMPVATVAAVRRTHKAAPDTDANIPAKSATGISAKRLGISLAALIIVLVGVVFILPDAVEHSDTGVVRPGRIVPAGAPGAGESPVAADVTGNASLGDERIEFNENDANYKNLGEEKKARARVEQVLGELLSNFETLERRSVQRWAAVPYRRARKFYEQGDTAYLKHDWGAAELHYLDALALLEPLFDRVEPEFEEALAGARAAFEAGDRAEALRLYELAVAITPNNPEARAGYERAKNLETVMQLVDQGIEFEKELELDAAEASFQKAVEIDPNWTPAVDGVERVRQTRIKMQFDARMSEGLASLANGDYLAARAAFRMARQLMPDSREPADGLLQVDQGLRLNNIHTLEGEAAALENAEHWAAAVKTYEDILEIDGNLSFAMDGLEKARRMSALHQQLDNYISDPDRLAVPSVMKKATSLVVDITRMPEIGPRLAGQRDELSRLLKRAATPVPVELVSDNMTMVSIYKVGVLGNFSHTRLELRPGTYVAVGVRPGFRDVRQEFRVAPEIEMQPVVVRCEEPI